MKLAGSYTFSVPPTAVWALLRDPLLLAGALPDCKRIEKIGPDRFQGTLHLHAGLVQSQFQGTVTLSEIRPGHGCRLQADGHSPDGRLQGDGRIWLEAEGNGTILHYDGDVQTTGRVLELGSRYLETVARSLLRQSFSGMARYLGNDGELEATPAEAHSVFHTAKPLALVLGWLLLMVTMTRVSYRWWLKRVARQVAEILRQDGA